MELPQYHIPQAKTVLLHVWERLKGFIIKAGTILFLACVVMWFLGGFGFTNGGFGLVDDSADSLLAAIGGFIAPIFAPLGFGEWQPVAASLSGFTAKEAIVSTMGVLANVAEIIRRYCNSSSGYSDLVPSAVQHFDSCYSTCWIHLVWQQLQQWHSRCSPENGSGLQSCSRMYSLMSYALCVYQIGSFVTGGGIWSRYSSGICVSSSHAVPVIQT